MAYVFKFAEINPDGSKNDEWYDNRELCIFSLRAKQQYWNEVFHINKQTIYLSKVLKLMGFIYRDEPDYCWKYEPNRFIDFGIGDYEDPQVKKFLNGKTDYLMLTFNCEEV